MLNIFEANINNNSHLKKPDILSPNLLASLTAFFSRFFNSSSAFCSLVLGVSNLI